MEEEGLQALKMIECTGIAFTGVTFSSSASFVCGFRGNLLTVCPRHHSIFLLRSPTGIVLCVSPQVMALDQV